MNARNETWRNTIKQNFFFFLNVENRQKGGENQEQEVTLAETESDDTGNIKCRELEPEVIGTGRRK